MFRRRVFLARRPFLGRPRLLFGALAAGIGYAAGRSRARGGSEVRAEDAAGNVPASSADEDRVAKLRDLADLHERGELSDDEFSAAKRELLGL
jgi:hypothetical protein